MRAPALARGLRPLAGPFAVLLAYAAARLAFSHLAAGRGLLMPSGQPNLAAALLGLITMALRAVALFVLPGLFAYRVSAALLSALFDRDRP